MAFFKPRKGGDDTAATARQPGESIEAMRRRAKHRLIGACVLVLVGVVGFPLLFDTQPRPIPVDIPIDIPDRNKVKPLPAPAAATATPRVVQAPAPPDPAAVASAPPAAPPASVAKAEAAVKQEAIITEAKVTPAPEPKPEAKPESKLPTDDGAKALALLEGKAVASTPIEGEGRFVVQVGSFSDNVKARETRLKVEHAGLKTYTQVIEKDGKRLIRVRVGPFATKADADRAAEKVKGLDLQPAVLTL
jgi:DedD protein